MSALPQPLPTISEELERKTLEECQRLIWSLSQAQITVTQFRASFTTLWNCVSGLVSRQTMDLIAQVGNQPAAADGSERVHAVLFRGGMAIVVRYTPGQGALWTDKIVKGEIRSSQQFYEDPKALREQFDKILATAQASGFTLM